MSKGRLTRHELSWLLTQEAQHAADRLRAGVQLLRTQGTSPTPEPDHGVDRSLDALDDVMRMLSNLNQRSTPQSGSVQPVRRGRIDLAALLVEVAPDARVSIEPGSGTEVYGEEADLRRLLQVLIGHDRGEGVSVTVRRDGDDVKVAVALGPDASPTAETERAWLTRMAVRYGGSFALEGGSEILVLPAEEASDRSESEALRKELDQARKQGEAYARELALVYDRGEDLRPVSTIPPVSLVSAEARFAAVTKLCAGLASELATALGAAGAGHAQEIAKGLRAFGELRADELPTELDLAEVAHSVVRELAPLSARGEVKVEVRAEPSVRAHMRRGAKAVAALVRQLVGHAIEASPRGSKVTVSVAGPESGAPARLVIDDAGAALPASARRAFLALETHGGGYGRPSALPVFLGAELAACLGASLELTDVPAGDAGATGVRVAVTFTRP